MVIKATVTDIMKIHLVVLILNVSFLLKARGKYILVETKEGAITNQMENRYDMDENLEEHGADYEENPIR